MSTVHEFAERARDHFRHPHCIGCGGCLLQPWIPIGMTPLWCIGCAERLKASPKGLPVGAIEFEYLKPGSK